MLIMTIKEQFWCVEKTAENLKANSLKVVAMSKQLMLMVLFNALICLLYVFFHVYLSTQSSYVAMDAFYLDAHGADPAFWTTHWNYFTWLFVFSTLANLYFIIKLGRGREAKQSTT